MIRVLLLSPSVVRFDRYHLDKKLSVAFAYLLIVKLSISK